MEYALDFRRLFSAVPAAYLVLRRDLTIVGVTDAYLKATLTTRSTIVGRGLFDVFPDNPDDPTADGVRNLYASLQRVIATLQTDTMAVQKYDIAGAEGRFEERYWSPRNIPVIDDTGQLELILHCVEDVTEFVMLRDEEKRQLAMNVELQSRAGRMEAEVVARSRDLQSANDRLRVATDSLQGFNEQLEQRVLSRTRQLAEANTALKNEMAERERIEQQFRQSQKMETLGQLAGGVAHDFNNLLTVILSCSELMKESLQPRDPALVDLADIQGAAQRAAALTRQLLAFSRSHVVNPVLLDLSDVVARTETMLRRLIGENMQLASVHAHDLGLIRADAGLVDQVLLNLVVNARDAMPRGGTLTIETANAQLDGASRGVLGAKPGHYVMLAVTDTGTGMDPETLAQLFTPFFTTKTVGRGTGLGLAMVHGVIKECQGDILVYSSLGKGTTFKVYFPVAAPAQQARVSPAAQRQPLPRPTETILLVEDEETVREVARRILERAGYTVLVANTPDEALALSANPLVKFSLLMTDVVMPGMEGPTFAQHLLAQRPGTPVMFMSGHSSGALVHQRVLASNATFLQKPFVPQQLLLRVREALTK